MELKKKYDWHGNDNTRGKVLKENMKNCRRRCDDMKADKVCENERT